MKPSEWGIRAVALAVCAMTGLVLILRDSVDAPIPTGIHVDVARAFRMPWWAALWPTRLLNKKKGK